LGARIIHKYITLFSIVLIISSNTIGQRADSCLIGFDELLAILDQEKIKDKDLDRCLEISQKLYARKCDMRIVKDSNGNNYATHSLTRVFADICVKSERNLGVDHYIQYYRFTHGSAEEERSYALERLLVKYPRYLLDQIGQDEEMLFDIAWGFLNNRYYGPKDPYEDLKFKASKVHSKGPEPVLNAENCIEIFFETNPTLYDCYDKYKFQIDFIITEAEAFLKPLDK
jgi:hypothetical protein